LESLDYPAQKPHLSAGEAIECPSAG
jgi:hypothetical protein